MNNALRIGNFTSSEIAALMSMDRSQKKPGQPYHTYVEECNMERRLGRSLERETNARALSWGIFNEMRVHYLLGTDYQLCSNKTIVHPKFNYWAGSPDFQRHFQESHLNAVADSKCPITLKSFCQLVQPMYTLLKERNLFDPNTKIVSISGIDGLQAMVMVRETHKDGDKYYYQLVSNGELLDLKYGELIVYMPYKSELEQIRHQAMNYDGDDQYRFKWIAYATDDELPHIPDGGYYKNINVISFPIPPVDKQALIERVEMAGKELIERTVLTEA